MSGTHYNLRIEIEEVTKTEAQLPTYRGGEAKPAERKVKERLKLSVVADDFETAIKKAYAHLTAERPDIRIIEDYPADPSGRYMNPRPIRDNPQA